MLVLEVRFGPGMIVVIICLLFFGVVMFIMVVLVMLLRACSMVLILSGEMPKLLATTSLPIWLMTAAKLLVLMAIRLLACS